MGWVGVGPYGIEFDWEEKGVRVGGVWRLLTFSAFRMGANSRWALIRGWALIQLRYLFSKNGIGGQKNLQIEEAYCQTTFKHVKSTMHIHYVAQTELC